MTITKPRSKHTARECEQNAARWLYLGNVARAKGKLDLAERHYAKSQRWHDKMNVALGNGDGSF